MKYGISALTPQSSFRRKTRWHCQKFTIFSGKVVKWTIYILCPLCHITPVLVSLHWLPIDLRIEFKILIITYKTLHGLAPAYIKDLLVSYIPGRYLRSAKKNLLAVPGFKLNSYGRRAFSVSAPLLWNNLPQHVRDAESQDIFKRQLKTVLSKRAF